MIPVVSAPLVDDASSIEIDGSEEETSDVPTLGARPETGWLSQSVILTLTGSVEPYFQTLVPSALNGARMPLIPYRWETPFTPDPSVSEPPSPSLTVTESVYEPAP